MDAWDAAKLVAAEQLRAARHRALQLEQELSVRSAYLAGLDAKVGPLPTNIIHGCTYMPNLSSQSAQSGDAHLDQDRPTARWSVRMKLWINALFVSCLDSLKHPTLAYTCCN